jgi:hypothetical protein
MQPTPEKARIRARAKEKYASNDVEIEEDPAIVLGKDGHHWVAAWVRVPRENPAEEEAPERVVFVYDRDAYFCAVCVPETVDLGSDDVHVYEEGVSDAGFTGYPKCAVCGRKHRWVALVVRCALCGADADADEAHRYSAGFIGACCWDERLRATE